MTTNQIAQGMNIELEGKIYHVESCVKVSVAKGTPFLKAKLRDLMSEKIVEKNFKVGQIVNEVNLLEHQLEFLYPEKNGYLFLDISNLEQVFVSSKILLDKINYLKEGIRLKAMFYGGSIFSVELPQFLELMVAKVEEINEKLRVSNATKEAVLETGAVVQVPLFVEVGDIIKIDTMTNEFIQRV
ncbi:MAG: elongation factor P [Chlamydiae bacterium]|nr:elongation factor P [Chlamydiota bacterium]